MATILIGVDKTPRSEDAIRFGHELAVAADARIVLVCAFPYDDGPSRAANAEYRRTLATEAAATLERMAGLLDVPDERVRRIAVAEPSAAHALHDVAVAQHADLVVVGSTHTGPIGRVVPGSTAERLLHGAPCAVAVVPKDYRERRHDEVRPVGVAWDGGTTECRAALEAAVGAARVLGTNVRILEGLEVGSYGAPALMQMPGYVPVREDVVAERRERLAELVASLPADVEPVAELLELEPVEALADASVELSLLFAGSRGYGPVRAVLLGGVTGRLVRRAACPLVIVPRGAAAPVGDLFTGVAASHA